MADDSGRVDRKVTGMTESNEQGPGQQLRAARELLGVSPREVADVLNLPLRVITALEADDYDGMSPTVFTRGYLRSYARLLELNADDLLAQYPQVQREPEPVDESVVVSNWRRPELLRAAGIAAALVVLLAIIVVLVVDGDEDVDGGADRGADTRVPAAVIDPPTTAADSSGARVDVAEPTSSAVQTETQTPTVVQMPVDAGTSEPAAQNVALVEPVAVPDLSEPESTPVADRHDSGHRSPAAPVPVPAGARRITDTGDDVLRFTFTRSAGWK